MEKILLMTDSSSDITTEKEKELGIKVLNMPITINGEGFFDRESFSCDEFYDILNKTEEIPATSQITAPCFYDEFLKAFNDGYTDVIYVSINEKGSSTYSSALQGKELLLSDMPTLNGKFNIHIIPSQTYSFGYGVPVAKAALLIKENKYSALELVDIIKKMLGEFDICFAMYTLNFAKKSGRLNATAAFVGELLGIRPLLRFRNGINDIFQKVRGDKNIIPTIADYYLKNKFDDDNEYYIVIGEDESYAKELQDIIYAKTGHMATEIIKEGPCIAINAGPKIIAIGFRTTRHSLD